MQLQWSSLMYDWEISSSWYCFFLSMILDAFIKIISNICMCNVYDIHNFVGTENVISACKQTSVSRLVHTSTIDVVVGSEEIVNGDEDTPIPKDFLFPGYPGTKYRAECTVVHANSTSTSCVLTLIINDLFKFCISIMWDLKFFILPDLAHRRLNLCNQYSILI